MKHPVRRFWREAGRQRRRADELYLRCEILRERLQEIQAQREDMRAELRRQRLALEQVIDNVLFASGSAPMFDPGAARFQPRNLEHQRNEAQREAPLTPAQWRARVELLDAEAADRDRRVRLSEELRRIAEENRNG